MENGNLGQFLQTAPTDIVRTSLVGDQNMVFQQGCNLTFLPQTLDIALGVEYLHNQHVVHGDLKTASRIFSFSATGRASN
jgi:serine/threonine protein kinase